LVVSKNYYNFASEMNRNELSQLCAKTRQRKSISVYAVCKSLNLNYNNLMRVETGVHSSKMTRIIDYLAAVGSYLHVEGEHPANLMEYDDLVDWLISARKNHFTQCALAKKVNCSNITIAYAETRKTILTVDRFLLFADALGYEISILDT